MENANRQEGEIQEPTREGGSKMEGNNQNPNPEGSNTLVVQETIEWPLHKISHKVDNTTRNTTDLSRYSGKILRRNMTLKINWVDEASC